MWTDNETSLDLLGFRVHAELIRSVVTDANLLPVTIGVFADWGGGKTSLMKMLEESFEPESWEPSTKEHEQCKRTACLYFNGWLFEGYDDAKSAILSSVLVALGEHKRFGPKVRDKCVSLLKSVNWMRVAHLGLKHVAIPAIAAYATGGASLVPTIAASAGSLLPWSASKPDSNPPAAPNPKDGDEAVDWESLIRKDQSNAGPLDVRTFREKFGQLLKDSDIDSLVVLIDDLDRCSPERIIENLEAIKLFLNVDNTAFIIGADPRIVRHAIAWKYKHNEDKVEIEDEAPTIVTDYLEKLIQYPYRLPRLSPAEIETYMALLFCQTHLSADLFKSTVSACDTQRVKDRYSVFGYAAVEAAVKQNGSTSLPAELDSALVFSASAAPLITEGLKGNPRQVKRFLNAFVLRKKLASVAKLTNINDALLVKLMILEYSNEKRFRELYDWQAAQKGVPEQLVRFEQAASDEQPDKGKPQSLPEEWSTPILKRWLKMKPSLAGEDLGDYFWIARDQLQSSISGMSLVAPVVRRVFEGLTGANGSLRGEAAKSASTFDDSEREVLFGLLQRNVKQNPSQKTAYDAYRSLIETNLASAAVQMVSALEEVPDTAVPPAVGGDLLTLIKAKPETKDTLKPLIDSWKKTDSQVGKMIKQLTNKPKD